MKYCIKQINELSHHGILGQKWGIRNYQYSDGSLTEEGKKRYSKKEKFAVRLKEQIDTTKNKINDHNEKKKKYLIENGTPDEIKQNIRRFNSEELSIIEKRFSTELKLRDDIARIENSSEAKNTVPSRQNDFSNAVSFISNNSKNIESSFSNAIKVYNSVAKVNNIFRAGAPGFQEMPVIPDKTTTTTTTTTTS